MRSARETYSRPVLSFALVDPGHRRFPREFRVIAGDVRATDESVFGKPEVDDVSLLDGELRWCLGHIPEHVLFGDVPVSGIFGGDGQHPTGHASSSSAVR